MNIYNILKTMDYVEMNLTLKADDALDALMAYKLNKQFGVVVECNPGGDRNYVVIDGVKMNHEQFQDWLYKMEYDGKEDEEMEEDTLPTEVIISFDDDNYKGWDYLDDDNKTDKYVRQYLRDTYNHYLSGKEDTLEWEIDLDEEVINVYNIAWGRAK